MGTKIKFAGTRAKKCDDLVSAEERMALLVGPQAELTYKKRNEEFMRLLVDNEDEALHRQLLKKLEEKIFLMNESTGGMYSTDDLCDSPFHNQSDSNVCVADKEVRQTVSPVGTDKDDVSELRQQEVEGQSQTHQSDYEPVNWILRVVDGIANPISRFWELEFHNKNRTKLSSPNKTKSVKLHFTQSAEKDAKTYSIGCLQIPTSSEGNNNSLNTKDSEVLSNAECGKTNIEFEMNDEDQLMNMLDLAYKLDGDIVSEVMRTIDQTLNGEIAESSGNNELMSISMSTLMRKESEENGNNELIVLPEQTFTEECAINRGTSEDMGTFGGEYAEYSDNETLGPTLDEKECVNNILNVPYSPIRRHTSVNEMEEGEIIDANENDRSLFDREQISKEEQSMLQSNSEKREEIFEDSVPEPMTPPCPNIPTDFEKNIASPKTPPPEEPSRFKEVIERREKDGFLGIITLDSDDE